MTLLALALLLLLLAPGPDVADRASYATRASEKCVVTYDTYALGHKVLDGGRYCVPWV